MLDVLQTMFLEEQYKTFPLEEQEQRREEAQRQLDVVMHRGHKSTDPLSATGYLEPDEDGFYPGLEQAGRLDV